LTAYQNGANFERRVKEWYERRGFNVIRSAGSHSQTDLLAWGKSPMNDDGQWIVVLIQCKSGKKKSYAEAKRNLLKVPAPEWWHKELWVNEGKKTYCQNLSQDYRVEIKITE
jgi:hypothetical protein